MISVVMASYLGNYSGAASNRDAKLRRAINSFLFQETGELIVVSDGCELTNQIVESYKNPHIKLIKMMKQPLFAGSIRQRGIKESTFQKSGVYENIPCSFFARKVLLQVYYNFQKRLTSRQKNVAQPLEI